MKKSKVIEIINTIIGFESVEVIKTIQRLKRGKIYKVQFNASSLPINIIIVELTHFYRTGLRVKVLARLTTVAYPKRDIATITFGSLSSSRLGLTFQKMPRKELFLYIDKATPQMEHYFKEKI